MIKKIGRRPKIKDHNIIFDGKNLSIGDEFASGKYNYFAGGPITIGNNVSVANYVIIETTNHELKRDLLIKEQPVKELKSSLRMMYLLVTVLPFYLVSR